MNYDVRSGELVFKHSTDEHPDSTSRRFQPHFHSDTYELFYYISGDAEFEIDGLTYELRSGTMLLIKPKVNHHIKLKSADKAYERITIRFRETDLPSNIRAKLRETNNIYFVRNSELSNELLRLDVHFMNLDRDLLFYTFQNSLNVILSYVINYQPFDEVVNLSDEVKNITNYIEDNLTRIENLNTICNDLHMSKSALCKKFTDGVGMPIMTYIRIRKCVLANALIAKGEKPTQIYKDCGFNDYASFYRAYKKTYKNMPSTTQKH